jgi:Protein of unknown function (DUF2806)
MRLVESEGIKQRNIEQIIAKANSELKEDAKPREIENDWLVNLLDKCNSISDPEMQTLWAKILASEANQKGSFSKRTVNSIASLDKNDAEMFTKLCGFCWSIGSLTPLIFNHMSSFYKDNGLSFAFLSHLDSIGLISFSALSGFSRTFENRVFSVNYFGTFVNLQIPEPNTSSIDFGKVRFTKIGQELSAICVATPIAGFVDEVIGDWKSKGYVAEKVI